MKWELIRGQDRFRETILEACKASKYGFLIFYYKKNMQN